MSLLDEAMDDFIILDKTTISDEYGGFDTIWSEGAPIRLAITETSAIQQLVAQQKGTKAIYNVLMHKDINLQFHDVVKRVRDGKIFRLTKDSEDLHTPASASGDMQLRQAEAEEWSLPNG